MRSRHQSATARRPSQRPLYNTGQIIMGNHGQRNGILTGRSRQTERHNVGRYRGEQRYETTRPKSKLTRELTGSVRKFSPAKHRASNWIMREDMLLHVAFFVETTSAVGAFVRLNVQVDPFMPYHITSRLEAAATERACIVTRFATFRELQYPVDPRLERGCRHLSLARKVCHLQDQSPSSVHSS